MTEDRIVRFCGVKFKRPCSVNCDLLEPTPDDKARHCRTCDQDMYLCASDEVQRVIVKHADDHPEKLQEPDWEEVLFALSTAYPCKQPGDLTTTAPSPLVAHAAPGPNSFSSRRQENGSPDDRAELSALLSCPAAVTHSRICPVWRA